jgi:hypothetical protein
MGGKKRAVCMMIQCREINANFRGEMALEYVEPV